MYYRDYSVDKYEKGGMMAKDSLPYCTKNGINFYINRDGTTANVIANIEDADIYMLDKSDLREMSLSAKIMGIDKVILHTNYGLELRSNEKPKIVGFDKIIKTQSDMAKGGMMADGGMMAKGGTTKAKGGKFGINDMVMVDDSGYIKLFTGFDTTKPAKIIDVNKVKTSRGTLYTYGLEFDGGKKPFNYAMENKLSLVNSGMMAKGGEAKMMGNKPKKMAKDC
jgi:hypothetical protein